MSSPETRILCVAIAFLLGVIAFLLVAYLSYNGNIRKSVLCGLAAFGGTIVGTITIENQLGLI